MVFIVAPNGDGHIAGKSTRREIATAEQAAEAPGAGHIFLEVRRAAKMVKLVPEQVGDSQLGFACLRVHGIAPEIVLAWFLDDVLLAREIVHRDDMRKAHLVARVGRTFERGRLASLGL